MAKKDPLAWNGAHKPKPPTEGFATSLGISVGSGSPSGEPAPTAARRPGPSMLEQSEGVSVDVKRMGEREGPEVVRPSGRVRLKSS